LKEVEFRGKVSSGKGEGRRFLGFPWVRQQIKDKLGFTPYTGTFNLTLSAESSKRKKLLEEAGVLKICPPEGYCTGLLFKASIRNFECGVVIPEVEGYPHDVLEVVASVNLKQKFKLNDGDEITVRVNL
jgi:riboflavin kinase